MQRPELESRRIIVEQSNLKTRAFSYLLIVAAGLTLAACGRSATPESASLVILDARVWTGDPDKPWAAAVAVRDDRIVAVGTSAEISAHVSAYSRLPRITTLCLWEIPWL